MRLLYVACIFSSSKLFLSLPKTKSVVSWEEDPGTTSSCPSFKLLLLDENLEDRSAICDEYLDLLNECSATVVSHKLSFDYDYWTADEILDVVLPGDIDRVTSYETIGHIGKVKMSIRRSTFVFVAHLNLKESHLPFKRDIGQVILDVMDIHIRVYMFVVEKSYLENRRHQGGRDWPCV